MITLSLTCHRCRQKFPSGVSLDTKGERSRPIDGLIYECPYCKMRDTYFTSEQRPQSPEGPSVERGHATSWWKERSSLTTPLPLSLLPLWPGPRAGWEEEPPSRFGRSFWVALSGGVAAGALGVLLVLAAVHGVQRGELALLPW